MSGALFAKITLAALCFGILFIVAVAIAILFKLAGCSDFTAGAAYAGTFFLLPATLGWLAERV